MDRKSELRMDRVSRRSLMRKGAATGALLVVGTAASGNAAAQRGGVGFITDAFGEVGEVNISGPNEWSVERTPDCNNQGQEQTYQGYLANNRFTLFTGSGLETPGTYELHNTRPCGTGDLYLGGEAQDDRQNESMRRVNIRPVTEEES